MIVYNRRVRTGRHRECQAVLKTVACQSVVGSSPTPSASYSAIGILRGTYVMAKIKKNETSCKITYEISCSQWALFVIAIYLGKEFPNDIIWTNRIYINRTALLEVKYDSVKKALEMDDKVRKFIKGFMVSKIKEKSYAELINLQ